MSLTMRHFTTLDYDPRWIFWRGFLLWWMGMSLILDVDQAPPHQQYAPGFLNTLW
ncbi:MAG: hypothetical protein P8I56_09710 [Paracoccaceae bacterium]|nr:hypothetical protein [Paracoccaceae bacterium]MDG1971234.1 hypothetical protein [Paracoccaceae bacterium]